jgi:acetoin utilization deacetylase AcuC-like enzyme
VFVSHPSSLEHDTGGHPEQPARIVAIERELESRGWLGFDRVTSPEVEMEALNAVHPPEYVAAIASFAARGGGNIDLDTVASRGSYEAALHAAGGATQMVDLLLAGQAPCAFSAHRPPGHHALPSRAMGFCLFNNVAVAARHALGAGDLERVMIVDWDVHHGNGTNDIFHDSREVLFGL